MLQSWVALLKRGLGGNSCLMWSASTYQPLEGLKRYEGFGTLLEMLHQRYFISSCEQDAMISRLMEVHDEPETKATLSMFSIMMPLT